MDKRIKISYLLLLSILFFSCTTPRSFTTIDVLRPAEISFDKSVKKLLIINNSAVQPQAKSHMIYEDGKQPQYQTLQFDSIGVFCTASLARSLDETAFFQKVRLATETPNHEQAYLSSRFLTKDEVMLLCRKYKTDAILSLDKVEFSDDYVDADTYYLDVYIRKKMSLTLAEGKGRQIVHFGDTLTWEADRKKDMPKLRNALTDASLLAGQNIAERLIPAWEKQDRYFYEGKDRRMQQAMDSVVRRNWVGAIQVWKKVLATETKSKRQMEAYNNIAVAYEMLGNYEQALRYVQKSIRKYADITIFSEQQVEEYLELEAYYHFLKKRKQEIQILNEQLKN